MVGCAKGSVSSACSELQAELACKGTSRSGVGMFAISFDTMGNKHIGCYFVVEQS
jgi:hypothetical protein